MMVDSTTFYTCAARAVWLLLWRFHSEICKIGFITHIDLIISEMTKGHEPNVHHHTAGGISDKIFQFSTFSPSK